MGVIVITLSHPPVFYPVLRTMQVSKRMLVTVLTTDHVSRKLLLQHGYASSLLSSLTHDSTHRDYGYPANLHTHAYMNTHACTHTRTHTHTPAHTHTHSLSLFFYFFLLLSLSLSLSFSLSRSLALALTHTFTLAHKISPTHSHTKGSCKAKL